MISLGKSFGWQSRLNLISRERRVVLTRLYWNWGEPGFGGVSCKLSWSLCWHLKEWNVGLSFVHELSGGILFLNFLCISLRMHLVKSYGGSYI
jgi:hypothetical protein